MTTAARTSMARRGFATFVAVVSIAFVGSALLAMAYFFQSDIRRSQHHRAETQLRQLLLAGSIAAVEALEEHAPQTPREFTIRLPDEVDDSRLSVSFQRIDQTTCKATISAQVSDFASEQVLSFTRSDQDWVLGTARITRHH